MRDRLTTLFYAFAALLLIIGALNPTTEQPEKKSSLPNTADTGRNGLAGLQRFLAAAGLPTLSFRQRYDALDIDNTLPSQGNLIIVTLPQHNAARPSEQKSLLQWVERGNTILLLVAGAGAASGFNAMGGFSSLANTNLALREFSFFAATDKSTVTAPDQDSSRTATATLSPEPSLAWLSNIQQLQLSYQTEAIVNRLNVAPMQGKLALPLLFDSQTKQSAFFYAPQGKGHVLVSNYAALFDNTNLGQADNAAFFWRVLDLTRRQSGVVIFDDMHQGLSTIYDPDAFFADPRLHGTLAFAFAFWLLYVIGHSPRLGPPRNKTPAPRAITFVNALGNLYARRVTEQQAALHLCRHSFNELREKFQLPRNGEPLWDELAAMPRVKGPQLEQLRSVYASIGTRRRINLTQLHNLLNEVRNAALTQ